LSLDVFEDVIAQTLNEVDSGVLLLPGLLAPHSLHFDLDVRAHDGLVLLVPVHVVEALGRDLSSSECGVGMSHRWVILASQMRS
jgi:hypothetical protein